MRYFRRQQWRMMSSGGRTHGAAPTLFFCFAVVASCGLAAGGQDRILSRCGRILSCSVRDFVLVRPDSVPFCPELWERAWHSGANCFGGNMVKNDAGSGADALLVPTVSMSANPPRARARREPAYDSEQGDQVQFLQVKVQKVQGNVPTAKRGKLSAGNGIGCPARVCTQRVQGLQNLSGC